MTNPDLIAMIGNISKSLPSIDTFIYGFSYIFGLIFCMSALFKFKTAVDEGGGQQKLAGPLSYLAVGVGLFFLPSLVNSFSATLFGSSDNILAYSQTNTYDIYSSMTMLIQTVGLVWFIRGCVLMGHGSQPGQAQTGSKGHGIKGLFFIIGGLFGINIYSTVNMVDYMLTHVMQMIGSIGK